MGRPKAEVRDFRSEIISAREAAQLLGISEKVFYQYTKDGVIPRIAEGKYRLGDVISAYYMREDETKDYWTEKARLTKLQADKTEIELSNLRGESVSVSQVRDMWEHFLSNARTLLLALPGKLKGRVPSLEDRDVGILDSFVRDILADLSRWRYDDSPEDG